MIKIALLLIFNPFQGLFLNRKKGMAAAIKVIKYSRQDTFDNRVRLTDQPAQFFGQMRQRDIAQKAQVQPARG